MAEIYSITALPSAVGIDGGVSAPLPGPMPGSHAVDLEGWIETKARGLTAVALEIAHHGVVLGRIPLAAHGDGGRQTFAGRISLLGADPEFDLVARVLADDGSAVDLALIRGQRQILPPGPSGADLLLITSLGRSGSSWLAHLLDQHQDFAFCEPWRHDIRLIQHWGRQLRRRTHPALRARLLGWAEDFVSVGPELELAKPFPAASTECSEWNSYLEGPAIERAADETRAGLAADVAAFRTSMAASVRGRVLVEKNDWTWLSLVREEWMPGMREILLVRDFRDTVCSWQRFRTRAEAQAPLADQRDVPDFVHHQVWVAEELRRLHAGRSGRFVLVRYEDLVQDPGCTLHALFTELGAPLSRSRIDDLIARANDRDAAAQGAHRTTAVPERSIGRWREDLRPDEADRLTAALRGPLDHFGYLTA